MTDGMTGLVLLLVYNTWLRYGGITARNLLAKGYDRWGHPVFGCIEESFK